LLRISVERSRDALSLVLEGRLVGPWVDELRTVWLRRSDADKAVRSLVDLCGVTAMDTDGQRLLDELLQQGATLRCGDVMNQYLVEQMGGAPKHLQEAYRPCRRFPAESDESVRIRKTELAS